ncbi:MAG TPA: type II toxin-antitoxin system RelE/ParE family toxin [Bryobacteraceae bacterium]|jgi:plasmid stabilization system protein ParE|nr:type II toxin-antitoxin system RelE/ParE family toxin [Bryobacteraceae bacterium]
MSDYVLTSLAKVDIFEIWAWIAEDNEEAADCVELAIYDACEFVAASPLRGHSHPDLTGRLLRFWTLTRYPNYTIVYRPETVPVQVLAVLHGKRNIKRILKNRA